MPSVASIGLPVVGFVDANGRPAFGGRVRTFLAGSDTLAPTYTDATGTVANPNPIPLNARGECTIWFDTSLVYDLAPELANGTDLPRQNNISTAQSSINFVPFGSSSVTRSIQAKAADAKSASDYATLDAAAASFNGGTIIVPNGVTPTLPATFGNVSLDYLGPNVPHAMYDETTQTTRAQRLIRSRDPGNHPAIEHSAFSVEAQPVGSGDPAVNATDFGVSISAVKKNWPTSTTIGQVVALNIGTRAGYHGTDTTPGAGDMGNIIINSVQSAFNQSVSGYEAATYYAGNGQFLPGQVIGLSVQLGIIKGSENVAHGIVLSSMIGPANTAIIIGNSLGNPAGDGSWAKALDYQRNDGTHAVYSAFQILQDGTLQFSAPPDASGVTTPTKRISSAPDSGNLLIKNHAGGVIATINDFGSVLLASGASLIINSNQVVGGRVTGWGTPTGTISRAAVNVGSGAAVDDVLARLNALILDLRAHGLIGT